MQTAFVDTNILLENIINPDFQPKFLSLFQEFELIIHEVVLLEMGNLIKKIYGSRNASILISDLIDAYKVYPQNIEDLKQGLKIMSKYDFNKPNKDYTLTDAILIVCAEKESFGLLSMDQEMGYFKFTRGEFVLISK